MFLRLVAFAFVFTLPSFVFGAEAQRGTVQSVIPCTSGGYAVALSATTTIIFSTGALYPSNTVPTPGQRVFAVTGDSTTCVGARGLIVSGISASLVSISAAQVTTAPPRAEGGASQSGQQNQILGGLQGLLGDLLNPSGPISDALGNAAGSALGVAGQVAGGPIYGGTYSTVIPCIGGVFYIPDFVGIPYSGPVTWFAPAPPYLVNMAAPPTPTQCHIGRLVGVAECCVGGGACFPPAPRIQFYGSSAPGCMAAAPPPPPPEEEPPQDCEDQRARICAAANAYIGADTSAGPDSGVLACAFAVNNVLRNAGVPTLDGNSVPAMEGVLRAGRGRQIAQSEAQCGDLAIVTASITRKSRNSANHVGICLNAGCTRVVSNSSTRARFNAFSGPNFETSYINATGRIYQLNCQQ